MTVATLFEVPGDDRVSEVLEALWLTPKWPKDEVKDRALIEELLRQFPNLDLIEEFGAFRVWLLAKGTGKEVTSRGRFQRLRNWCSRAGRTPARTARTQRRAGTAARPAGQWGPSGVVEGW